MSLLNDVVRSAKSLITGHKVTLQQMLEPPLTLAYPDELPDQPYGSRGLPTLKVNQVSGEFNCVACGLCARACPPSCIEVIEETDEDGKRMRRPLVFNIDMGKCMVCNLCIEACPFDALEMAEHFALSGYEADDLVLDKDQLAEIWRNFGAAKISGGEKL